MMKNYSLNFNNETISSSSSCSITLNYRINKLIISNDDKNVINLEIAYLTIVLFGSLIASSLNIISASIFKRVEFRNNYIYNYLRANSIIDAFLLILVGFYAPLRCTTLFKWINSYKSMKMIEFLISSYVSRVFKMMSSLLSITITIYRYLSLNKRSINERFLLKKTTFKYLIFLYAVLSILINLPNLFVTKINNLLINSNNKEAFNSDNSDYFVKNANKSKIETLLFFIQILINLILLIIVIIINVMLIVRFKKSLNFNQLQLQPQNQQQCHTTGRYFISNQLSSSLLQNENDENNEAANVNTFQRVSISNGSKKMKLKMLGYRLTLMIIYLSIIFIMDNLFINVTYGMFLIINNESFLIKLILTCIHILFILSSILNIFVYYYFNKYFAFQLKLFFKRKLCFVCFIFFK